MDSPPPHARLSVNTKALAANWQACAKASEAATCGAAVKANGYGLGAREVAEAVIGAGCRDLFVANWTEAAALGQQPDGVRVAVLHGVMPHEMTAAMASSAVPVLCTPGQVAAWRSAAPGRPCDVMVDTGMNRLGLTPEEAVSGLLDGLLIDVAHSHLACAEQTGFIGNAQQLATFRDVTSRISARRRALANSAGLALGPDYHFDLTRPGLRLYGGGSGNEKYQQVVGIEARIIQLRSVMPGDRVGYAGRYMVQWPMRIAIVALGYADGYPRGLTEALRRLSPAQLAAHQSYEMAPPRGFAVANGIECSVVGRISMDLAAFDVSRAGPLEEGDWLHVDLALERNAKGAARTQYELLTSLGARYARIYS